MIVFHQWTSPGKKCHTGPKGRILQVESLKELREKHQEFNEDGTINDDSFVKVFGNAVNLETGEIIANYHQTYQLPAWVHDPLLRAMKVVEFKQQQKKTKDSTNENTGLHRVSGKVSAKTPENPRQRKARLRKDARRTTSR